MKVHLIPEEVWSEVQDDLSAYRPSDVVDESSIRRFYTLVKYEPVKPNAAWFTSSRVPPFPWNADEINDLVEYLTVTQDNDFCELRLGHEACQD